MEKWGKDTSELPRPQVTSFDKEKEAGKTQRAVAKALYGLSAVFFGMGTYQMLHKEEKSPPPTISGPASPGVGEKEPKQVPVSVDKNPVKTESATVKTLQDIQSALRDPAKEAQRPAMFRRGMQGLARCQETNAVLKQHVQDLAVIGIFLAQNLERMPQDDIRVSLEGELKAAMSKAPKQRGAPLMVTDIPKELVTKHVADRQWWIAGCSGMVVSRLFLASSADEKFAGKYAQHFASFIDLILKGEAEKWPESTPAAQAMARIFSALSR